MWRSLMVNAYGHNTQLQLFSLSEVSFTASFTEKYLLYINKIEDPPLPLIYTLSFVVSFGSGHLYGPITLPK